MKLISASVTGLFGRKSILRLDFKPNLNILTGKNGSGKTTVMKLIWYVIGGQIVRALAEVDFARIAIETSLYSLVVVRTGKNTCRVLWRTPGQAEEEFKDELDEDDDFVNAEDVPNARMRRMGSSIFFPTFRRIEGGFSSKDSGRHGLFDEGSVKGGGDLETALNALSNKLSTQNHRFVSALSTSDIEKLLLKQYTDASEDANRIQQETSTNIINEIKEYKQDKYESTHDIDAASAAEAALDNIRSMIEDMDRQRVLALAQYEAIRELVLRIFAHSSIKVGRLSIGEAAASISSDSLSAGEKQMLSFLCYNAFYESAIIFIDEPELSLHIDWQRQLFPTLFSQHKDNQFIIATHSPFIYSRYPDSEIVLHVDRGNSDSLLD